LYFREHSGDAPAVKVITRLVRSSKKQGPGALSTTSIRILNVGSMLVVVAFSLILFSTPLRHGGSLLAFAQDDLYYYLVPAKNLVAGLGSTFDGTTLTNGYHPLYFLLLLCVVKINGGLRFTYAALWLLDVASAVAIFSAVRILVRRRLKNPLLTNGFAFAIVALSALRIVQQMEVTLTLPIGMWFLVLLDRPPVEITPARWAGLGFVGTLLVLSRLDAAILVLLCLVLLCTQPAYRRELTWNKVAAFAITFLPFLLLYLGINQHYFHRLTPISGAAKQARVGLGLFGPAIYSSLPGSAALMFLASLLGLFALPAIWRHLSTQARVLYSSMLLFPFLHFGANWLMSDWMIFPWYRYSLLFSLTAVLLLLCHGLSAIVRGRAEVLVGGAVFLGCMGALLSVRYVPDWIMIDIAESALFIQNFARTHPGRYAMGDRAGMVGYTDGVPTVQLEGLMMDDSFLRHIRQREPLHQLLRDYHIDYYIGFDWRQPRDWPRPGCFHAREPSHAGPDSPVMLGDFCQAPVAEHMRPSGRTLIFDVRSDSGE
jgi:hypothetical protein